MPHLDIRRLGTTRDQLGESPCWDDEAQALCWIDALAGTVHRLHPWAPSRRPKAMRWWWRCAMASAATTSARAG